MSRFIIVTDQNNNEQVVGISHISTLVQSGATSGANAILYMIDGSQLAVKNTVRDILFAIQWLKSSPHCAYTLVESQKDDE